jgi:acetyltransferase-like isoleucine patch superfamily enzyme
LKETIEKIIAKLKNDPTYKLDNSYTSKQLFFIVWYRSFQIWRGLILRLNVSSTGMVFCGRRVVVQHGYQFKAGKNLILEDGVRINALSEDGISFGDNVTVASYSVLVCTGVIAKKGKGILIGNNSAIGSQSFLGGQGGIAIGNDVIMGPQVKIFSENHNFRDADTIIRKQGELRKGVSIGHNCWIGAGAIILDGVVLGKGCVVAAGSVVTKSFSDNSVLAGVPATLTKIRG